MRVDYSALVPKKFLGIPYKLGGRSFTGCDCIGILWLWFKEQGINLNPGDGIPYSCDWSREDNQRYMRGLLKVGKWVPLQQTQPDDVVLFLNYNKERDKDRQFVDATGLVITPACFLHMTPEGSTVSQFTKNHVLYNAGAIRIHEVEEAKKQRAKT